MYEIIAIAVGAGAISTVAGIYGYKILQKQILQELCALERKVVATLQAPKLSMVIESSIPALMLDPLDANYYILKQIGDKWVPVGKRRRNHPDIMEALATSQLAVRKPDGSVEYGNQ